MFKKHAVQMKVVKTDSCTQERRPLINEAEAKVLKSVGKAMAYYVLGTGVALHITAAVCTKLTQK